MELTQKEIQWIKDRFAEEQAFAIADVKNKVIEKARFDVAKKHEIELKRLADEGKIDERKALIEQITQEANEAESAVRKLIKGVVEQAPVNVKSRETVVLGDVSDL